MKQNRLIKLIKHIYKFLKKKVKSQPIKNNNKEKTNIATVILKNQKQHQYKIQNPPLKNLKDQTKKNL